jgi:hypothetical protein
MKRTVISGMLALLLCACTGTLVHLPTEKTANATSESASFAEQPLPTLPADLEFLGKGELLYDEKSEQLTATQEELLLDYVHAYYSSLAQLEALDNGSLFVNEVQPESDSFVLQALIQIRQAQPTDLSLTDYTFTLTVQTATQQDNGDIRVMALEDAEQHFAACPGVDSLSWGLRHSFLLTSTPTGWRLQEHRQIGSLTRLIMGQSPWQPGQTSIAPSQSVLDYPALLNTLVAETREDVAQRVTQGQTAAVSFDLPYERSAAMAYARQWAHERNPQWLAYDGYGGNCQNFTSQALFAGGIPMDYTAPAQWKWYDGTPNSSFTATGRAPAWTGVAEFKDYAEANRGYGLVAQVNAPYYSGEPGDVIHMSANGLFRHTVMITEVLRDANGQTVDYLIASNTANLRDFPVSAFYYTEQTLIKIYGWNN